MNNQYLREETINIKLLIQKLQLYKTLKMKII